MKTYPVIFSGPMIRALLDGRKVQTRRLVTSQWANLGMHHQAGEPCLLYVREMFCGYHRGDSTPGGRPYDPEIVFAATSDLPDIPAYALVEPLRWRPSIHMPRRASRLTLQVTDVRLQKLRQIGDEDAEAEGFTCADQFLDYWFDLHPIKGECYQGDWQDNPQVAAISFRVHRQNIDDFIKQQEAA